MNNHEKKLAALKIALEVSKVIVDAVREATEANPYVGAPGGHLYAACMNILSLAEFESMMGMLVKVGFIEKRGECYFWLKDM